MKKLLISFGCVLFALTAVAVPARRIVKTVTLADGSTTTVTLMGDERCHFYLTADSHVLMSDNDGNLFFAAEDADGRLVRSSELATAQAPESTSLSALSPAINRSIAAKLENTPKIVTKSTTAASSSSANPSKGVGLYASPNVTGTGSPHCLVFLVEYSDVAFTTTDAGTYFNNMINQTGFSENSATGSVLDYFVEASMGQFTPIFDVYGPITLPNKQAYYGGNDSYGDDKAADDMVRHAADILADSVDFSIYDNDGDGEVDNVFVIYAGKGEASGGSANTVWPHSYDLQYTSSGRYQVDGVYFNHYACSNEIYGSKPDGIGTFVHEFSHVLGLPDLYTTDYGSAYYLTPNAYSALDYGSYNNNGNTPPTYGAYERNALGWIDCIVLDSPTDIELPSILTSNKAYIIPTTSTSEFFLLENRQQTGSDKYIPGHGMLIWHIHYNAMAWTQNTVNNSSTHQYVDIEEACGTADSSSSTTMAGYPFPGTSKNTEFSSSTTPALEMWSGTAIDMPITEITETDGIITALADGGTAKLATPLNVQATALTDGSFTASWDAVADATDYLLTVYAYTDGEEQTTTVGFDDSSLPDGWTAAKEEWFKSSAYCGTGIPAFKISTDGNYLQTAEFDGEITALSLKAMANITASSTDASSITVYSGTYAKKAPLDTINTLTKTVQIFDVDADFSGVSRLCFVGNKTNGNIAIDDISITVKTLSKDTVDAYDGASTSGACTYTVSNLPAANKYGVTVKAINDEYTSRSSAEVYVSNPSGIADITSDADALAPVRYFNLQGMPIANPTPGAVVIRQQGSKVTKIIF